MLVPPDNPGAHLPAIILNNERTFHDCHYLLYSTTPSPAPPTPPWKYLSTRADEPSTPKTELRLGGGAARAPIPCFAKQIVLPVIMALTPDLALHQRVCLSINSVNTRIILLISIIASPAENISCMLPFRLESNIF